MTSSNKFANGANQNCGNVITDRSSTRIHHAPGGSSSIILGDGSNTNMFSDKSGSGQAPRPGSGYQGGYKQTQTGSIAGASMTPQQQYAAELKAQIDAKKGSVETGKADGEVAKQRQREATVEQNSQRMVQQGGAANNENRDRRNVLDNGKEMPVSSNKWANGANQNAGNMISDRPSTRIHHAPGGQSSLVLG